MNQADRRIITDRESSGGHGLVFRGKIYYNIHIWAMYSPGSCWERGKPMAKKDFCNAGQGDAVGCRGL